MKLFNLSWPFGQVSVRSKAAMLWDCNLLLPSGRWFAPFARAPWAEDPAFEPEQPAYLRHLGGEFVCVPFGVGGAPKDLLPGWASDSWKEMNRDPHGYSAGKAWECIAADASQVTLRLQYPAHDDIAYLIRRVSVVHDAPALDFELTIHVRRPTRQPVGLHPILRLPEWPSLLGLETEFAFGLTYPATLPPGISRVGPGQRFERLDSIPGPGGELIDYRLLPKESVTEELLMLCNVRGPVVARYIEEGARMHLSWDTAILPSCLLWVSDRSFADTVWRDFRGIGIEPIAAVFDAAAKVSINPNPLNQMGVATAVDIDPACPRTIRYRIEVFEETVQSARP
jgi:hypothetical protein